MSRYKIAQLPQLSLI